MVMDLVKVLPAPEKADQIKELLGYGWSEQDIVDKVFGAVAPEYTMAVRGVAADPHGYDTDVDEIAVDRALQGDRDVWESLTHYERRRVLLTVAARRELEVSENREEKALVRRVLNSSTTFKGAHDRTPPWFLALADDLGLGRKRLADYSRETAAARVL